MVGGAAQSSDLLLTVEDRYHRLNLDQTDNLKSG